ALPEAAAFRPCASLTPLMSGRLGDYGHFQLTISVLHVFEKTGKFGQGYFAADEVRGTDFAGGDCFKRFTYKAGRVMEARFDVDFRVVQCRGFQLNFRALRTATEEVYRSAAPDHSNRPLPG